MAKESNNSKNVQIIIINITYSSRFITKLFHFWIKNRVETPRLNHTQKVSS